MDAAVLRAMAKWPDVPAVFGWLGLDERGNWLIRGERISNTLLIDFIGRNYGHDSQGRWFFQNGPQRVFVTLAYTPWVLRVVGEEALCTHTGAPVRSVRGAWLDREGVLVLDTEHGPGIVDDRDVEMLARRFEDAAGATPDEDRLVEQLERVQAGSEGVLAFAHAGATVSLLPIRREEVPQRLGYEPDPKPLPGERGAA